MSGNLAEDALACLLAVGGQLTQRMNEICERHGITNSQYNVLRILAGCPDGQARCDIAKRLIDRAPDVTRLVDRLERSGLVERSWSPENRRHSIARITPAGATLLDTMKADMCAIHQEFAAALSPADLETLVRIS
jgi:DNA-binding MarR family transcriptional regulator